MPERVCAIVPAAGEGRRLGEDKALVDLGGVAAIERVAQACAGAAIATMIVVRRAGAAPLPASLAQRRDLDVHVVVLEQPGEMIDSVRAGLRARPADAGGLVVFPVDYAMVTAATVAQLIVHLRPDGAPIVLPLWRDRPGHPIVFAPALADEILAPATATLRDVIRREGRAVCAVPVDDGWVRRDLDEPLDLRDARAFLADRRLPVAQLMADHRSRRAFHPDPITDEQLERWVHAARFASTSSFMQAYSVVAVREADRKERVAGLCADLPHIRQAPLFLALCADLHKIERCCARHGAALDADSLEIFLQATIDTALLGQNLLLAAEAEGLGGCMLGAARSQPVELAAELALPPHAYVVFGLVLGRPADDPVPRGRMPLRGVLHHEQYDAADLDGVLDAADAGMRVWASLTNEGGGYLGRPVNETRGWSDRMANLWARGRATKDRRHLRDALRRLGFGLDSEDPGR